MSPTEDRAIVDAGLKALAFDSGPPLVCNEPAATYERASNEHGRLAVAVVSNRAHPSVEAERHDAVGPHPRVLRAKDHPLQIGLCNDQAIERIVVMRRQAAGVLGMSTRHRHDLEAERQHRSDDRSIEAKLPDRSLDSDFPYCRRADEDLVRLVAHRLAQPRHDPAGPLIRPQKDMRVDQQPHALYSKYFCISGGRGASKSSAMYVIPSRFCPNRRFFRGG
jgi:hypothetical protein